MTDKKYESAMNILEDELKKELECLRCTKQLIKRTSNPFRLFQLKRGLEMFEGHIGAISMAIIRIKKEVES